MFRKKTMKILPEVDYINQSSISDDERDETQAIKKSDNKQQSNFLQQKDFKVVSETFSNHNSDDDDFNILSNKVHGKIEKINSSQNKRLMQFKQNQNLKVQNPNFSPGEEFENNDLAELKS